MAIRFFIPFKHLVTPYYTLQIEYGHEKTSIIMSIHNMQMTTDELSATLAVLSQQLPNIYTSECFNEAGLPFSAEVQCTEIGHLFEHIMLEYLCSTKLSHGHNNVEFSGVTRWNWKKHPRGTFSIDISATNSDRMVFNEALKKTILLMNLIFTKSQPVFPVKEWYNHLHTSLLPHSFQ